MGKLTAFLLSCIHMFKFEATLVLPHQRCKNGGFMLPTQLPPPNQP
jgi:hypothetical protein